MLPPHTFLATIGEGRGFVLFPKKQGIFAHGNAADTVFYVRTGKARLTVVSNDGKEAIIGILGGCEFLCEGTLTGQALHMGANDGLRCSANRQESHDGTLHREHEFSNRFVAYLC